MGANLPARAVVSSHSRRVEPRLPARRAEPPGDHPRADVRLDVDDDNNEILTLDDPKLFKYPVAVMWVIRWRGKGDCVVSEPREFSSQLTLANSRDAEVLHGRSHLVIVHTPSRSPTTYFPSDTASIHWYVSCDPPRSTPLASKSGSCEPSETAEKSCTSFARHQHTRSSKYRSA